MAIHVHVRRVTVHVHVHVHVHFRIRIHVLVRIHLHFLVFSFTLQSTTRYAKRSLDWRAAYVLKEQHRAKLCTYVTSDRKSLTSLRPSRVDL